MEISGHTRLLCLIGSPVAHSGSPAMHNYSFEKLGLDYRYLAFDIKEEDTKKAIEALKIMNFRGCNITMPGKTVAASCCDELSKAAQLTGAINTIVNEDGKLVENSTLEKEIKVDAIAPQFEMTASAGFAVWYQKEAKLHVRGMDRESGIQEIACYVDGVYEGKKKAVEGEFVIQKPSAGGKSHTVTIIVKDQAGNQNSQIEELYIDQMAPRVKIGGAEAYMITSRPVTAVYEIEEENLLSEAIAETQWEDVEGKKTKMEASEWEETKSGKRGTQTLTEDGIYQIRVKAKDRAGYEAEDHRQIIIDKANPVIGYVDDLQGKYLKSFMWNYLKEELIQDFTTYTYGIKLDGNLYQMGKKIETEGRHLLEVQAVDAAGNEVVAKAEFVIDHTKPEIVFSNVEEGNEYEEKCVCKVELRNAEDAIQRVQINGEDQKIDAGSASFQCTLQVHQDYEVEVTAVDQAGNKAQESILFKVVPKKNIFQKIYHI